MKVVALKSKAQQVSWVVSGLLASLAMLGEAALAGKADEQPIPETHSDAPSSVRPTMEQSAISAEIEPAPNQANQAALSLQRLGFRILHIGPTISVQGSEEKWKSVFNVSFETRKKSALPEIQEEGEISFRKANTEHFTMPNELRDLVKNVTFVEPPEFY